MPAAEARKEGQGWRRGPYKRVRARPFGEDRSPPQQKHIVCRKGEGERSNGDDGREERREGQRCERDGRCGGWLAREIMERWRAEKLGKVKEAR